MHAMVVQSLTSCDLKIDPVWSVKYIHYQKNITEQSMNHITCNMQNT